MLISTDPISKKRKEQIGSVLTLSNYSIFRLVWTIKVVADKSRFMVRNERRMQSAIAKLFCCYFDPIRLRIKTMRTICVLALVASLMIFTGCTAINGPNCGGQWNGFCEDGSCGCDTGGIARGFSLPAFGRGSGCGTDGNFSDYKYDCGPMCGAYLNNVQTHDNGCGCDSCQVGQSYLQNQWGGFFGGFSIPRIAPFAGLRARLSAGQMIDSSCDSGACDAGGCDSGGCDTAGFAVPGGSGFAATCRGLGASVGCGGCNDCGTGAIGTNHSACSTGFGGNCGPDGCGLVGGAKCRDGRFSLFRRNGSPHPYGGELPHTGAPADSSVLGGGPAPTYAYPYYTTRGPRDFLMMNPPSIGR